MNTIQIPEGVKELKISQESGRVVIEFVPEQLKFKKGDKVRIKDGINSGNYPIRSTVNYHGFMDACIGQTLTVSGFSRKGNILVKETNWIFHEDWLELYSDEPKEGELAIFWDFIKETSIIRVYGRRKDGRHLDNTGDGWIYAIKFESKEQFEKHVNS